MFICVLRLKQLLCLKSENALNERAQSQNREHIDGLYIRSSDISTDCVKYVGTAGWQPAFASFSIRFLHVW